MIVHSVKPQMPDDIGDISTTFSMIFIMTSMSTTSMPILPGYAAGGTRKLSQLTKTMMNVGKYVWKMCFTSCLKLIRKRKLIMSNSICSSKLDMFHISIRQNNLYLFSKIVQINAGAPLWLFPYIFPIVSVFTLYASPLSPLWMYCTS